jgi:hypothetical protein
VKHCKCEFGDQDYRLIRIAAAAAGLPIKQWVQRTAAEQAALATGLPLPCTRTPQQTQEAAAGGAANGTQTDAEEAL